MLTVLPLPFSRLVHADWSVHQNKRWQSTACRIDGRWLVQGAQLVGPVPAFVDDLLRTTVHTLAGFDFPIGVPKAYGHRTGLRDFPTLLAALSSDTWRSFFEVAEESGQISVLRPFYPQRSTKGSSPDRLVERLELANKLHLLRTCERPVGIRKSAGSPLFWTLGGKQVGKAALAGWREVMIPAHNRGAKVWPFAGALPVLAGSFALVIAETYPAETYGHLGIRLGGKDSGKRSQSGRLTAGAAIRAWAQRTGVSFTSSAQEQVDAGFGVKADGEDPFDALVGLLGMIEVADGRRPAAPPLALEEQVWEGWILGQYDRAAP